MTNDKEFLNPDGTINIAYVNRRMGTVGMFNAISAPIIAKLRDELTHARTELAAAHADAARLREERDARDWEQATMRAALLFVWSKWSKMQIDRDGGSARFTLEELKKIEPADADTPRVPSAPEPIEGTR